MHSLNTGASEQQNTSVRFRKLRPIRKGIPMSVIHYKLDPNKPLSAKEKLRLQKLADELKNTPIIFDKDCMPLTAEQLMQIKKKGKKI